MRAKQQIASPPTEVCSFCYGVGTVELQGNWPILACRSCRGLGILQDAELNEEKLLRIEQMVSTRLKELKKLGLSDIGEYHTLTDLQKILNGDL